VAHTPSRPHQGVVVTRAEKLVQRVAQLCKVFEHCIRYDEAKATMTIDFRYSSKGLEDITFDLLAALSDMLGTRQINLGHEEGGMLSEVTWDEGRTWISVKGINAPGGR
jgi:hypothetical protein